MRQQKNTKPSGRIIKSSREPDSAPASDMIQTGRELTDDNATNEAVDEPGIMAQPLESRPFSTGRKIENHLPHDDEITERLVQHGVDDAEENDVVTASKTGTKSEG
jgi:hypothetical protein